MNQAEVSNTCLHGLWCEQKQHMNSVPKSNITTIWKNGHIEFKHKNKFSFLLKECEKLKAHGYF